MPDDTQLIVFANKPPMKTKKALQFELFPEPEKLLHQTDYERNTNPEQIKKFNKLKAEFEAIKEQKEREREERLQASEKLKEEKESEKHLKASEKLKEEKELKQQEERMNSAIEETMNEHDDLLEFEEM